MSNRINPMDQGLLGKISDKTGDTGTVRKVSTDVPARGPDHAPQTNTSDTVELTSSAKLLERLEKTLASLPEIDDARVEVYVGDVADCIRTQPSRHDAIVLDVDNGPHTKSTKSEGWLYTQQGLGTIRRSLRPHGVLSIWSAGPSLGFTERLIRRGFVAEEIRCRGRGAKGNQYHIWIAQRNEHHR